MREQLQERLQQLKAEFDAGQQMLAELEAKQRHVRETVLRISRAVQVLEELLAEPQMGHANSAVSPEAQGNAVMP